MSLEGVFPKWNCVSIVETTECWIYKAENGSFYAAIVSVKYGFNSRIAKFTSLVIQGYNINFVWMYARPRRTCNILNFYYDHCFRITFWHDLSLSVRLVFFCPTYSIYRSQVLGLKTNTTENNSGSHHFPHNALFWKVLISHNCTKRSVLELYCSTTAFTSVPNARPRKVCLIYYIFLWKYCKKLGKWNKTLHEMPESIVICELIHTDTA